MVLILKCRTSLWRTNAIFRHALSLVDVSYQTADTSSECSSDDIVACCENSNALLLNRWFLVSVNINLLMNYQSINQNEFI